MIQLGRVTASKITKNKDGDKNVILLQVELSDPDDIQSVEYVRQAGEDNNPPNDSSVIVLSLEDGWKVAIAVDDGIEPTVNQGEREIYSSLLGVKKATVKLDKLGNIDLNGDSDFAVAFNDLKTAFDQLKSDFNNFVTTNYNLHNHPTAPTGPVSPPSLLGSTTAADMSGAKVANVRFP